MALVYNLRCQNAKCDAGMLSDFDCGPCPNCGGEMRWVQIIQRDTPLGSDDKRSEVGVYSGFKIAPDLSGQQQAYIETPEVQAKLKSGEYTPIQRGSDEWNHGH